MAPTLMRRCYRSIPNGVLTAHDLGGLQCEVASQAMTTAAIRGNEGTDFCLVIVAQCVVCWFAGH